jgi:hypothetical protein
MEDHLPLRWVEPSRILEGPREATSGLWTRV